MIGKQDEENRMNENRKENRSDAKRLARNNGWRKCVADFGSEKGK